MNTKMHEFCFAGVILALVMASTACNSTVPATDTTTAVAEVKYVPEFNSLTTASASMASSRSVTFNFPDLGSDSNDPRNAKYQAALLAPVVIGVSKNTSGYKIGDSFTSTIFGNTVTTVISEDELGNVVYTGKWADDTSYYKLVVSANGTGTFEHRVDILSTPANGGGGHTFVVSECKDVTVSSDGSLKFKNGTSRGLLVPSDLSTVTTFSTYYYKYNMATSKTGKVSYVFQVTEEENWKIASTGITTSDLSIASEKILAIILAITPDGNSNVYTDSYYDYFIYRYGEVWTMTSSKEENVFEGQTLSGKSLSDAIWAAL